MPHRGRWRSRRRTTWRRANERARGWRGQRGQRGRGGVRRGPARLGRGGGGRVPVCARGGQRLAAAACGGGRGGGGPRGPRRPARGGGGVGGRPGGTAPCA